MKKLLLSLVTVFAFSFSFAQLKVVAPNGDVGIGIANPTAKLHISDAVNPSIYISENASTTSYLRITDLGTPNCAIEKYASTGNALIDINPKPLDNISASSFRFFRSTNTTGAVRFQVYLGDNTNSANCQIGGNSTTYLNRLTGNVGIGTNSPTEKLSVDGDANKPGGGSWATFSDKRLKKDILKYSDGLKQILQINPVTFKYNGKAGIKNTEQQYVGVIAQEMEKIAPYTIKELVYQEEVSGTDVEGNDFTKKGPEEIYKSYNGTAVTYMLVNAVKEQQEIIENRNQEIEDLRNLMIKMEDRIVKLENVEATSQTPITTVELNYSDFASVDQNNPNPFNGITTIAYYVPFDAKNASLEIYGMNGKKIKSVRINNFGKGQVKLDAKNIPNGVYTYNLIVDSKVIGTHKMSFKN